MSTGRWLLDFFIYGGKPSLKQMQVPESKILFIKSEILFLDSTGSFKIGWGFFIKEKPHSMVISCEICFDQGPDQMTAAFRQQLDKWKKLLQAVSGRCGGVQLIHWELRLDILHWLCSYKSFWLCIINRCAEECAHRTALQGTAGGSSQHWLAVKPGRGLLSPGLWMLLHRFVLQQEIWLRDMIRRKGYTPASSGSTKIPCRGGRTHQGAEKWSRGDGRHCWQDALVQQLLQGCGLQRDKHGTPRPSRGVVWLIPLSCAGKCELHLGSGRDQLWPELSLGCLGQMFLPDNLPTIYSTDKGLGQCDQTWS